MSRAIKVAALFSAGVIALGGLSAACDPANNEPQAKRTVTERTATAAKKARGPLPKRPSSASSQPRPTRVRARAVPGYQSFSRGPDRAAVL